MTFLLDFIRGEPKKVIPISRILLADLITQVMVPINQYLNKTECKLMASQQAKNRNVPSVAWNSDTVLAANYVDDFRNKNLTLARTKNLMLLKDNLQKKYAEITSVDIQPDVVASTIRDIQGLVDNSLLENESLSIAHAKNHRTYQQSRSQGFGIFSSFAQKTWFQSRATRALEHSQQMISAFVERHKVEQLKDVCRPRLQG